MMAPSCSSPRRQYHGTCACIRDEDGGVRCACVFKEEDDDDVILPSDTGAARNGYSPKRRRRLSFEEEDAIDQAQIVRLLGCASWRNLLAEAEKVHEMQENTTNDNNARDDGNLTATVIEAKEICSLCARSNSECSHETCAVRRVCALPSRKQKLKRHWKWVALAVTVVVTVFTVWLYLPLEPSARPSQVLSSSDSLGIAQKKAKALVKLAQPIHAISPAPESSPQFPSLDIHGNAEMERVMDIYCRGPILHAIQMAHVFSDSKHFVDMPIKDNSSAFDIIMDFQYRRLATTEFRPAAGATKRQQRLSHELQLRNFVSDHFDPPGSELSPITPFDYQELQIPPMIADIQDEALRDWAFSLHQLWRTLGRMPNPRIRSSYLHAKPYDDSNVIRPQNVLIVPGGRFRESYYWDSYWIVQGLLVSNMKHTARGIVNNLLEYVAEFGFVPNGGRIYYLTRSQPPMLSDMVKLVAQVGHNATLVEFDALYLNDTVPILETEYRFWMQLGPGGHAVEFIRPSVDGEQNVSYLLNRYTSSANHPRPESYREDVDVAAEFYGSGDFNVAETESKKDMYYNDIIAAAESGWDFSSRWLGDKLDMKTMLTSCIIPVDLNAIMYRMEKNLEIFHEYLGNTERAQYFRHAAHQRILAMNEVLWSDEHNTWKDFNLETLEHSKIVTVSDYTPLWAKAFEQSDTDRLHKVVKSLQDSGLLQVGGIQTTNMYTGQQWDAPNAWPPEQDIVIEGLLAVNTKESHKLARELMQSWVHSSLTAWRQTGLMFEKYNATEIGGLGVGGEYFPQFGFGWTNGVILKFLTIHQNLLLD